jgi:hypothetical protein
LESTDQKTRKERRSLHKTLKNVVFGKDGAVVEIGNGQVKGGKATRWAVRCSVCTPGTWFTQTFPNKLTAVSHCVGHVNEKHKGERGQ